MKKTASKKKAPTSKARSLTKGRVSGNPGSEAPLPPPVPKLAYILPGTLYAFKTDAKGDNYVTIMVDKSQAHRLDGIQRRVQESFVGVLLEPVDPKDVDNLVENSPWGGLEGAG